jgi:hypothetical protein
MNNCQSEGGCFRAVPPQIGLEAGIGFYKYPDARVVEPGDMWVAGVNCWVSGDSFTIGTNEVGSCLNINKEGWVDVPLYLTTQELVTDSIRAQTEEFLTINDNVIITGNLRVDGLMEGNTNPFWIAGKFAANGTTVLSSRGRYPFTVVRNGPGFYTISPSTSNPFPEIHYLISLTCQVDGQNASARVVNASASSTSFSIVAYNNNVATDQIIYFTVLA